ncbi:hypothetical protein HK405_003674 [Cladochytrium tenue]|nr:hypothetical protein HK405_003674 [Cladochytrium tenue]
MSESSTPAKPDYRRLSLESPRYAGFVIKVATYKRVPLPATGTDAGFHDLAAYILLPRSCLTTEDPASAQPPPSPLKLIAKFHGGGLVSGAALFPPWFPVWLMQYATEHRAAIVAPNYRLMPESSGPDAMQDVMDFWKWVADDGPGGLTAFVAREFPAAPAIDLARTISAGESAGGLFSVASGLELGSYPTASSTHAPVSATGSAFAGLRAVIATYPGLDIDAATPPPAAAPLPPAVLAAHLRDRPDGLVVSEAFPPARLPITLSLVQQGLYGAYYRGRDGDSEDPRLWPLTHMRAPRATVPPYQLLVHGLDDPNVPSDVSRRYVDAARELWGPDAADLVLQPGGHNFDPEMPLDTPWIRAALAKVTKAWES